MSLKKKRSKDYTWKCREEIMAPIIICALGTVSTKLGEWLEKTGIECTYLPFSTKRLLTRISKDYKKGDGGYT